MACPAETSPSVRCVSKFFLVNKLVSDAALLQRDARAQPLMRANRLCPGWRKDAGAGWGRSGKRRWWWRGKLLLISKRVQQTAAQCNEERVQRRML